MRNFPIILLSASLAPAVAAHFTNAGLTGTDDIILANNVVYIGSHILWGFTALP